MKTADHVLLTFRVSHYCEAARFMLLHYGVPFREQSHYPLFSRLFTARYQGGSTPCLHAPEKNLTSTWAIFEYLESHYGNAKNSLLTDDAKTNEEIINTAKALFKRLGPATRRCVYYPVLVERADGGVRWVQDCWRQETPLAERVAARLAAPMCEIFVRRGLNITSASVARSQAVVDEITTDMEARLADSEYLFANRFTIADLALVTMMAPYLIPGEYGRMQNPEKMPFALRKLIDEWRSSELGKKLIAMYERNRPKALAT